MVGRMDTANIANYLEQLPVELHEPILSQLSFRDIIALDKYADEGGCLAAGLATSPAWEAVWPVYTAHRDDFQTLISLVVRIGGQGQQVFDPTGGAFDVTPGQFHRRIQREKQLHGTQYDFFECTVRQTSRNVQRYLINLHGTTMRALTGSLSLDAIATLTPWITHPDEAVVRSNFFTVIKNHCRCQTRSPWPWTLFNSSSWKIPCKDRHPGVPTPDWTLLQIKVFMNAYSAFQTQINSEKAQQLQNLAALYTRHHSRLKEPFAPQEPRRNAAHIPKQLDITAGFVERIVDLDPTRQPGTKQGKSRFRYPHACLIPYDWCLRLWVKVVEENPGLVFRVLPQGLERSMSELAIADEGSSSGPWPPEDVVWCIHVAEAGLRKYYFTDNSAGSIRSLRVIPSSMDTPDTPSFFVRPRESTSPRGLLLPVDVREMEWLVAFLTAIEWMEGAYPDLAAREKPPGQAGEVATIQLREDM